MKKVLFSIFILSALVFCFTFQANADTITPQIGVSGLLVGAKDNQITGQFNVTNGENFYVPDLNYSVRLFKGTDFNTMSLVDTYVGQDVISLPPKNRIIQSFIYNYPKNIESGMYTVRVQVVTAKGAGLGWKDQVISLTGNNNFLDIQNSSAMVLVGNQQAGPVDGITVSPTDNVVASLKVTNSGEAITVIPNIRIFKRQYNMDLLKQYQDVPIIFAKGETKTITLTMPKFNIPESYLAEVKFLNNNNQVSGIQYFRWVVEGQSAKILNIATDKDSYAVLDNMKITVTYVGPADFSVINGAKLKVTVYDENKNTVATKMQDINLNMGAESATMIVPTTEDLFNPTINAQIINNNQQLDDYKITLPVFSKQAKQLKL